MTCTCTCAIYYNMRNELGTFTQIHNRYQVFDASGQLPFSIVIGLCRKSPADTDPRPLLLETAGSVLDVQYALANGLLTLHEQDPQDVTQSVEVDLSQLSKVAAKEAECLSLSSRVNRTEHWRDALTVYKCHVDVDGELASYLKPGKKYTIRLASEDLGVKRWAYSDHNKFFDNDDGKLSHDSEAVNLVNSRLTASKATFTVVKSLPWPPKIETRMRLCASSSFSDFALPDVTPSSTTALEVSVTNTGSDPVTVQTQGHQVFLVPWGPFQPEPDALDDRVRIIGAATYASSGLNIVDSATGEVVRGKQQRGACSLTSSNANQRPKAEDVLTLKPGAPVIKKFDVGALVQGLGDGLYKIRMQPRGCRWWHGEAGKEVGEDGRVPAHLGGLFVPPLMLESQDEIELRIRDGKVDESL